MSRVHRVALQPLAVLCVFTIGARDGCRSHSLEAVLLRRLCHSHRQLLSSWNLPSRLAHHLVDRLRVAYGPA